MSTNRDSRELEAVGVPELTPLGKRIELLRIERRMSKGILAQRAGTSRQQLWRVMTGKSELTSSLCARLADVLEVDSRSLRGAEREVSPADWANGVRRVGRPAFASQISCGNAALDDDGSASTTLETYVAGTHGLERTFATMPSTEDGRRLKRALLNAVEDIAESRSMKLPATFFDLRRRVVNDEH
jgi:transcriptional regulator with XRE-family HTH domain